MKIENNDVLDLFREKQQCELCNSRVGQCEPHHYYPKGMGGGHQMDVEFNLVALCRTCHQRCEDGVIPRRLVLLHIANRHGTTPEAIQESLWLIDRLPKGTSKGGILAAGAVIGGEVERILRLTFSGVGV